jgi:hypothetical protein
VNPPVDLMSGERRGVTAGAARGLLRLASGLYGWAVHRRTVAENDNPTRICSAGCIYTLLTALPHTQPTLLRYDQTVLDGQNLSVSCAAFILTEPDTAS